MLKKEQDDERIKIPACEVINVMKNEHGMKYMKIKDVAIHSNS